MLTVEVLPPRITNTEVDKFFSISGLKTWRFNEQVVNKVGFINANEDIQGLCCPSVWDKSFSEHFVVKTELSHWVKTEHSNSFLDITLAINKPEVDNVNSNYGLKALWKIKQVIDIIGFVNKNKNTERSCGSGVLLAHSLGCFDINFYLSGSKRIQKQLANIKEDRKENDTLGKCQVLNT